VRHTYSRGTLVYDRGQILTEPGHGRFVQRSLQPNFIMSR
jgi:dihydropyrimidinase